MLRALILLISFFFSFSILYAQINDGIIKGKLVDTSSKQNLADATISVIDTKDSSLITYTLSDKSGAFEIKSIENGNFRLLVSLQGYETFKKEFSITAEKRSIDLGELQLQKEYKTLKEVIITEAPVMVKGDTIAFRADAFKTKPNATVEDLLKKMPGMQVEKDGTVKAQGENVQKVYVDGKEFFGTDPKLATKNLTADMIDQVEVFDDMSEQAKFNRIDDGSRSKSINLKLKKEKKKGIFGKVYTGYGTKDHYDAGITANFFRGATQVSLIAKANNTNNIGFSMTDMLGMITSGGGGGGGMGGGFGGGGMQIVKIGGGGGNFGGFNLGSGGSGITSSWQAGLNYRDTWSKSFDVNGSYFFNHAQTDNLRKSFRQSFYGDSIVNRDRRTLSQNENNNHRFNFNVVFNIDSLNSIIFSPSINVQKTYSLSDDTTASYASKNGSQYKTNDSRAFNESTGDGINWSNNLIWRKKFHQPGRTLSIAFSNTFGDNQRDGMNRSVNNFYGSNGSKLFDKIFDQKTDVGNKTNNYGATVSYTEPLAKDKVLEVNYSHNRNMSESDRKTFDYNGSSGKYDFLNDSLSNNFKNQNESDRVGSNFRVVKKKYNYQLGLAVQRTLLESNDLTKKSISSQRYTNIFPSASFNYQFARSRNFRFTYRGRSNQPSISQLQAVPDVSDPLYVRTGNPLLKQEFTNNLNINYTFFDIVKFRSLFVFISFGNTYNKIANSTVIDNFGRQVIKPVNLSGTFNANSNFTIGFPIKKMKGGNINTNTRISFVRDANLVNSIKNYTRNLTIGEDVRLNYSYKEKLDMGIGANVNFTRARYTIQENLNTQYFTHTYSADISYTFPKNFILSTDFDYTFNTGRSDGFNQNFAMWNAGLAKQLLKNKRAEIKLSVFDIMSQNVSLTRNVGENYVEDVENTVLQRFFMLTFTYNLNRMGGKNLQLPKMLERGMKGIRITQ